MKEHLKKIIYFSCNLLWVIICLPAYLHFFGSGRSVARAQSKILSKILKSNRKTRFGRDHDFSSLRGARKFQERVPVTTYEDYIDYIERIQRGEGRVLTHDAVIRLMLTSGSASASKCIPYTPTLKREFLRGIRPWVFALYAGHKTLFRGRHYWSITPSGTDKIKSARTGVVVGFGEDGDYFSMFEKILLRFLLVVPQEVSQIRDIESLRYVSLLYLLTEKELRFVSIWNPLFFTLMLKDLPGWFPQMLDDLGKRRIHPSVKISAKLRQHLEKRIGLTPRRLKELNNIHESWKNNPRTPIFSEIWPHLTVVSCWVRAHAAPCIQDLMNMFPGVVIQPKGLMATEGVVSLPLFERGDKAGPLAITSHFFEFLELDTGNSLMMQGRAKIACELEVGKKYMVLLTTGGGLYRYNLQDIVEVTGLRGNVPLIRFIGKADSVSDLAGEKLNSLHVGRVLSQFFSSHGIVPAFYLLAPERSGEYAYAYTLFIKAEEGDAHKIAPFAAELDNLLAENFHYRYCRKLKQLGPARIFLISGPLPPDQVYCYRRALKKGAHISTTKIPVLDKELGWSEHFQGAFIEQGATAESAVL